MREHGFTLIELIVVLVILGITAAVAVPALGSLNRPEAPAIEGAHGLAGLLQTARKTAMEEGVEIALQINPVTGEYTVSTIEQEIRDVLAEGVLEMPQGVKLSGVRGSFSFVFQPLGPGAGPPVTVTGLDSSVRVELDPWTGEPQVPVTPHVAPQ